MVDGDLTGNWRIDEANELENTVYYQKADGTYGSASLWNAVVELKDQENVGTNWYGPTGQANWFFSAIATGISNTEGSFRLSTTKQGFSPHYYANAWRGNQYTSTYNIAKIGKLAGRISFGIALVSDGIGVVNYYYNPNSPNVVHPGKASVNTAVGIWGLHRCWHSSCNILFWG